MDKYNHADMLSKKDGLFVFFLSSFGHGEPTDNARSFFNWLHEPAREQVRPRSVPKHDSFSPPRTPFLLRC